MGEGCQIVGRPIGAKDVRKCDFTNRPDGADVMYAAPDDLIYELEPMLEMENEMETSVG